MMRRVTAVGLLLALLASGIAYVVPLASAEDNFSAVTGSLQPAMNILGSTNTFSPGDDIRVDLTGTGAADGAQDIFDVVLFDGAGRTQANRVYLVDNVALVNGRATATIPGAQTQYLADGPYQIDVCVEQFSAGSIDCTGGNDRMAGNIGITIQLYTVSLTTNRDGFIAGEELRASWKALFIRNGTPAEGFNGNLTLYERVNLATPTFTILSTLTFSRGVGNASMTIPTTANDDATGGATYTNHSLAVRYDGFTNGGRRTGYVNRPIYIANLNVDVTVSPGSVPEGNPFTVSFHTYVRSVHSASNWPLPAVDVQVGIFLDNPGTVPDTYFQELSRSLTTDATGRASFGLIASGSFVKGNTYGVIANASKILRQDSETRTFGVVQPAYPITVTLTLDGQRYLAGSTVTSTAIATEAAGRISSGPLTYVFMITVRDPSNLAINRLEVVQTSNIVTYLLPTGIDGSILVDVSVYNSLGDYGRSSVSASVVSAEILINVDPSVYDGGQTVRVSYQTGLTSPSFYFTVSTVTCDPGCRTQYLLQGNTTATSFNVNIPAAPAPSYTISVTASSAIDTASGTVTINLRSGYAVRFSLDRNSYAPGDVATVTYKVEGFGNAKLPNSFQVRVCIASCITSFSRTYYTDRSEDSFSFTIDPAVDTGQVPMSVSVYTSTGTFLGSSTEGVSVRGGPSLGPLTFLADVSLMEYILLALVVVLFVLLFKAGILRAPAAAPRAPKAPKAPKHKGGGAAAAATVGCRNCGASIEVTTARRPIDVMCPNCGETQRVE